MRLNAHGLWGALLTFFVFTNATYATSGMPVGQAVSPPLGYIKYCLKNYQECRKRAGAPQVVRLDKRKWQIMQAVQRRGNESIRPRPDILNAGVMESWDYPRNGYGDCEDYALIKKRMLLRKGFPSEALLLTTAITERGEAHVVLTVVTDQGDFVLDNRFEIIQPWQQLAYNWRSRQSAGNPLRWHAAGPVAQRYAKLTR